MSDLAKHIEILLLDNDCVIVPGFGGFMAHHVDAVYVEEEGIFLPPLRTLGFNPQLHVNDSLLAQSYVEAFDISYPEALRQIESDVRELKHTLSNEGSYELPDIGELTVNDEGNYVFTPCLSGVLTPDLYALTSFEMPRLKTKKEKAVIAEKPVKNIPTAKKQTAVTEEKTTDDSIVAEPKTKEKEVAKILSLNTNYIRAIAAVAIIFLVMVFAILPVGDSSKEHQQLCSIDTSLLQKMMPQMRTTSTEDIKPVKVVGNMVIETARTEEEETTVEEVKTMETSFVVVLASGVTRKNAESYIDNIKKYDIHDARIINNGTINHIVCGSFSSREEANKKAETMRHTSQFTDVWVMETKN